MGGSMTYQRFRKRNGLMFRVPLDDRDPYAWHKLSDTDHKVWEAVGGGAAKPSTNMHVLAGDLNRMEWGYTDPDSDYAYAAEQVAAETGVDVEAVRKVLRYVFFEQR